MKYGLLYRTVKHLRPTQVLYQVKNRLIKPAYKAYDASGFNIQVSGFKTKPIDKYNCLEGNVFTFLNQEHKFAGWNFTDNGMLWAYNQNYFDWLNQGGASTSSAIEGCKWIDKFIEDIPANNVGLDPYPIALRSINWVKFFCRYPESATEERLDSLYSQLRLLEKKLEYHLLANHLLEDAYALYVGAAYFDDERLLKKAGKLLLGQLKEQILSDGAHYEQSVMYHCILLDRLLDCINIVRGSRFKVQGDALNQYAERMLGHLESVVWADGSIPMFNDAAEGIAPTPSQIFDYAKRLGLKWEAIPMKECGYRKLQDEHLEAIVDVGNITATYQPGHTHADTFNYELRINGKLVVVDTGISTYNVTKRRQYERSTKAHNCVCVNDRDSSEVWGGFRVGKRCKVQIDILKNNYISVHHNGFDKPCYREFSIENGKFTIEDKYQGSAISYIHLAPGVSPDSIKTENVDLIETVEDKVSTEYNKFKESKVVKLHFKGSCKYTIG